jgi:LacI family transcriptional regulator
MPPANFPLMPGRSRVTLKDIADEAGVDKSTVSLALRDDPRIKESTRRKIVTTAARIGYRPDPHLASLMEYVRSSQMKKRDECIAYLKAEQTREEDLDRIPFFREFHRGAESELDRLGYSVEVFRLREYAFKGKRLSDVLYHRGIRGIVVSPPAGLSALDTIQWQHFGAITMGYRLRSPRLCRVVCDQVAVIRTVMENLAAKGYMKPLLAFRKGMDAHVNRRWSIAFAGCLERFPQFCAGESYEGEPDGAFVEHWRASGADCVIGLHYSFARILMDDGVEIPQEVGFVLLDRHDGPEGTTGIDQQPFLMGQFSARQLSGFLDRNETGIPEHPFNLTVPPIWNEGQTLPPRA